MTPADARPLVFIDGNCQGQALAAILHHSGLAQAYAVGGDIGFVPSYRENACLYVAETQVASMIQAARRAGRYVVQATQSTPTADGAVLSYSGDVDLIVRYPQLQFYAQSPGEFASHFGRDLSAGRLFPFDLSTVKVCQDRAGSTTDFALAMKTTGLETPLFHSALHPGGFLTSRLVADLAGQLPGAEPAAIEAVVGGIAAGEGMNFISCHPVPRARQAEFGAEWRYPYPFYADLLSRAAQGDWAWIMARADEAAALLPADTQTWNVLSLAALATGDDALASLALDRLLSLSPGFNEYWRRAFDFCRRRGDAGFADLVERARAFFGDQRQYDNVMSRAFCERGQWTQAEFHARAYLEQTPERFEGLAPLLSVYARSDRAQDARALALEVARGCPANRLAELKAVLSEAPGVDWTDITAPDLSPSSHVAS